MDSNAAVPRPYVPPIPPPAKSGKKIWIIILTVLLVLFLMIGGCCAALFIGVHKALRSSDVYAMSMQRAQASPCVVSKLGQPIVNKDSVNGNINKDNGAGDADLTIPIEGPQGKGTLHAVASRENSVWTLTSLTLNTGGADTNLPPDPGPCQ